MQPEQLFIFGSYRFAPHTGQVWRGTQEVRLTGKAAAVLRHLVARVGWIVTKEELFHVVWPDTVVSEAALTSCIQELRQALHDQAKRPRYIETVHRRGFRFLGKVVSDQLSVVSPPPSASPRFQLATENGRLSTPLVSRDAELAQLHQWLAKALTGECHLAFVSGESGIGKTTLLEIFVSEVWSPGLQEESPIFFAELNLDQMLLDAENYPAKGRRLSIRKEPGRDISLSPLSVSFSCPSVPLLHSARLPRYFMPL